MEAQARIANKPDDFETWLAGRPKWIQTAAARLATIRKMPTPEEVRELTNLCIAEANNTKGAIFESIPLGIFGAAIGTDKFKLQKLDKVVGVNAIRDNASLNFGDADLAVIFGMNGSGKSGYSRLLKHVCGARHKTDLLPNVFVEKKGGPSCEVTVATSTNVSTLAWNAELDGIRQLRSIHVFDSLAAGSYVDSKNEASYEPRRMRFLSSLIKVCDAVASELTSRKTLLPRKFPATPPDYIGSNADTFVQQLRHDTKAETVDAACLWREEDAALRQETEQSLKLHDIAARIKQLGLDERTLALFKESYDALKLSLSDAEANKLFAAKAEALHGERLLLKMQKKHSPDRHLKESAALLGD